MLTEAHRHNKQMQSDLRKLRLLRPLI